MKKTIIALLMMLFFITTVYSKDTIKFTSPDGLPALHKLIYPTEE